MSPTFEYTCIQSSIFFVSKSSRETFSFTLAKIGLEEEGSRYIELLFFKFKTVLLDDKSLVLIQVLLLELLASSWLLVDILV